MSTDKVKVEYNDMTPTWQETVVMLLAVLESGDAKGKRMAREELMRAGRLLDGLVEERTARSSTGMPERPRVCPRCDKDPEVGLLHMNNAFRFMAQQPCTCRACGAALRLVPSCGVELTMEEGATAPSVTRGG
jgi:hypothetical protein